MKSEESKFDKVAERVLKEIQDRENKLALRKLSHPDFPKYFRYTETSKPEKGDIIAKFGAVAEIVEGMDKDDLIDICLQPDSAHAAAQMMRKIFHAAEWDAWGVPRQITEDLVNGMSEAEIKQKPYSYAMELFFYTKPEYMPKADDSDFKYWSLIRIVNLDDYLKIEVKNESEVKGSLQESEVATDDCNSHEWCSSVVEIQE